MQQNDGARVPIPSWYGREGFTVAAEPNGIHGVFTHGGQLLQYNVFGHLFDVTAKYRPPVKPISRGAYGVVWYGHMFIILPGILFVGLVAG